MPAPPESAEEGVAVVAAGGEEAPLPSLEETFDDYQEAELYRDR